MKALGGLRSAILNVTIKELDELYECYMPFVTHGGLFIATNRQFLLEDEVFVVLELLNEAEKFPLTGKVIWITPPGVVVNRKQGIGIQFSSENAELVAKIETHLAGMLNSDNPTHTL
jgi:type IV pilus assembly protein PilZ